MDNENKRTSLVQSPLLGWTVLVIGVLAVLGIAYVMQP